jgi:hypothetical protein
VPQWYKADYTLAYYDIFAHPQNMPPYALGELDFWWYDADKAAKLKQSGACAEGCKSAQAGQETTWAAYILRRLLLIIPTLIGIMLVNFTLTQFVPGGPIEQIIARVQGEGDAFAISPAAAAMPAGAGQRICRRARHAARILAQLEVQMGFARITCAPPTRVRRT